MGREMRKGSGFRVQAGFYLNPDTLTPDFSEENPEWKIESLSPVLLNPVF